MLGRYSMTKNWYGIGQEAEDTEGVFGSESGQVEATGEPAAPAAPVASPEAAAAGEVAKPPFYKRIPWWGWAGIGLAGWLVIRRFGKEKEPEEAPIGPKPTGWWRVGAWAAKKAYRKIPRAARQRIEAKAAQRAAQAVAMGERLEERWWRHGMEKTERKLSPKQAKKAGRRRSTHRAKVTA